MAGSCLIGQCPLTQLLSLGSFAVSACDAWESTHTLTASQMGTGTGGLGVGSIPSGLPASTTFSTLTSTGAMMITSSAAIPTTSSVATSTSSPSPSPVLSLGAEIGLAVGAFIVLVLIVALAFCLRRRTKRHSKHSQLPTSAGSGDGSAHELQTTSNIHELPDKVERRPSELDGTKIVTIPPQELSAFEFPFQNIGPGILGEGTGEIVEADSRSARAGHPRGRMAGTEATVFDFESQKVLLEPGIRDRGSSVASAASRGGESRGVDGMRQGSPGTYK